MNHTSSEHRWFKKARMSKPNSQARKMYVWSDTPEKYKEARIIFKDFELSNWSWDNQAKAYYWHRFYSHQPDLNFNNSTVVKSLFKVIDFWFGLGVDGLRLDAVPYLFEREGSHCENLPETHTLLKRLRSHVDTHFKNKMLIAEANQWPEDAAAYMGNGDECHMAFHFPLMPRMFMSIQSEDSFPIADILRSTPPIPDNCQWGLFLRNHDELTLEMVTDEERDYMYRVYASDTRAKINLGIRRRLATLLENDRRKIELMNILLLSLPGTPIIYYGDEIGMGDNFYLGDRDGVRTPMQWGPDKNAGFSDVNPHRLYLPVIIDPEYHYETINVTNQESNIASLLWWMRKIIATRKRYKAFGRGTFEILNCDNSKVFSFVRTWNDEIIVVVVNLSRYCQIANIDMRKYSGLVPEEAFGKTIFPIIKNHSYLMMMGPFDYFWLILGKNPEEVGITEEYTPALNLKKTWESIFSGNERRVLEERIIPRYLMHCRWFGSKTKKITRVHIIENFSVTDFDVLSHFLILNVNYSEGNNELYQLTISFLFKHSASEIIDNYPQAIIADISVDGKEGILYDCIYDESVQKQLYKMIVSRKKIRTSSGTITGFTVKQNRRTLFHPDDMVQSKALKAEQSNTAVLFDESLFLKVYRRLENGTNPELEMMRFLSEKSFYPIPPFAGALEYRMQNDIPITLAILQGFVKNSGDAWTFASGIVKRYFETILAHDYSEFDMFNTSGQISSKLCEFPQPFCQLIGELFIEMINVLGRRTAQMHCTLSSDHDQADFSPESFSQLYQRSLFQSMQGLVQKTFRLLEKRLSSIPLNAYESAKKLLDSEQYCIDLLRRLVQHKITTTKIRIHGDYHLGQVLYTGKDFVIMDFEGEPARALSERKLKRSPFRDVAGMIRSFDYVAHNVLLVDSTFRETDYQLLSNWIDPWYHFVSTMYLQAYLSEAGAVPFIPKCNEDIDILIQAFLLEKAVYELGYELNNRPEWVIIPIKGILRSIHEKIVYKKLKTL
jgi:maltose alpha-D-glucosyltransferase/alpha-amylase